MLELDVSIDIKLGDDSQDTQLLTILGHENVEVIFYIYESGTKKGKAYLR